MQKSKPVAIIDIRSESVGGALVEPQFDSKAETYISHVIRSSRHDLIFQLELNRERFFTNLVTTLKQVLSDLFVPGNLRPAEIICFLSAPFYAAQTRTIRQTRPAPTPITQALVAGLVDADRDQFQAVTPALYREILHDAHELIEHKVMQIKLNRYLTNSPYGQLASEIEVSHYLSVSSKKVLDRFREVMAVYLPRRVIFHSFSFAFFSITRDLFRKNNFLLLDLGGEVTEMALVADDVLWETVSFPLGHNFLIRRLAKDLKTVPEEIVSAFKIYHRGGHDKIAGERLNQAIEQAQVEWLKYFKEALAALTESHFGSNELLATGNGMFTPIFLEWIKRTTYQDLAIPQSGLTASLMTSRFLEPSRGMERSDLADDHHLLLETVFYDKLMTLKHL